MNTLTTASAGLRDLWTLPTVLIVSILLGGFFSIVPNLVGAASMAWLGTHSLVARSPAMWAGAGALSGWSLSPLVDSDILMSVGGFSMAAIGATSALLCRWGTDWAD